MTDLAENLGAPLTSHSTRHHIRPQRGAGEQESSLRQRLVSYGYFIVVVLAVFLGWKESVEEHLTPESGLGYALGIVGGVMMLLLLLYPLRKKLKVMRSWGKVRYWFQAHMLFGVIGPVLVLFHANFQLGATNSNVALGSMLLVVASGLVGRYIYSKIHHGLYGRRMTLQELHSDVEENRVAPGLDLSRNVRIQERLSAIEEEALTSPRSLLLSAWGMLTIGIKNRWRRFRLLAEMKRALRSEAKQHGWSRRTLRERKQAVRLYVTTYLTTTREIIRFCFYERLFSLWHVLHLPFFLFLVLATVAHIVAVHLYSQDPGEIPLSQTQLPMRLAACLGLAAALLPFAAFEGQANVFEKLLMPGEVIQGHAKYEDKCESCHEPFEKELQLRLCLACHKDVRADIDSGQGFHGKRRDVKGTECKHCHTDHKGRGEDIVLLDKETFDHKVTDFPLLGGHLRVKCQSCHSPDRKYREAPAKCVACHKKQDPHGGRLGKACANCHTAKAWREGRFNHDKTRFSLRGKHRKVSCKSCHPDERYKRTPTKCADCHRLKDVHEGRYGKKCQTCHSPKSWQDMAFNHNKTKFPLVGRHARVRCNSCHTGHLYKQDLPLTCFACHKTDDEHKGRNGKKCESCHTPRDWKQTGFNHDKKTKFPLKGGHAKLQCEDCHRGQVYKEKLDTACHSCHRGNDVHKGTLGKNCADCHNDRSWSGQVFFDHDLRRFPLIGLHATTSCEECHLTPAYEDTAAQCVGCHRPKDVHKSRLGSDCGLCHNPNGWALWRFDHNTQTGYRLDGKHTGLNCQACHKKAVKRISLSTACLACHRMDDVHRGSFGKRCESCHTTDSFKTLKKFQ